MKTYIQGEIPTTLPNGKVAVTVYFNHRSYGGPEEGGWWYNDPVISSVYVFSSLRKAKMFLRSRLLPSLAKMERGYRAYLEFPGRNPTEVDSDGHLVSARPYHLRQVYRDRELLCRPHYC